MTPVRPRNWAVGLVTIAATLTIQTGLAAPTYTATKVLVPPDQYNLGGRQRGLSVAPIYKPHDARTSFQPEWWITSNERTGCAGITILANGSDRTLATVNIDEPNVGYHGGEESSAPPCVGYIAPTPPEPPEGSTEPPPPPEQFPANERFSPSVCLPVVLPPGQTEVIADGYGAIKSPGRGLVCAPLGAERHARHPHGITVDWKRNIAYQVIEHAGLRWNANRSAFQVANTTDEESGLTLAWDVSNPRHPRMLKAYLNGHGAHEVTVNQRNGLVFQGNHEDSPGVTPTIWVDVINPRQANPYGFIDTGYFNAIQGIDVDEGAEIDDGLLARGLDETEGLVYGTTHVGEKMFAFDANCVSRPNPSGVVPPPAPPGYALPADSGMQMGWNCIKYWVDLRPPFLARFPELAAILSPNPPFNNVLHMHNLVADKKNHRAYQTVHSIHDAEHTGLSDEEPPVGTEEETGHHYNARYVIEVGAPTAINPLTKQASAPVHVIDLSHGFGILQYPNVGTILNDPALGLPVLLRSFVHAHFIAVDPTRRALLVSGEHTGNLGVVNTETRRLEQVIPISRAIPGCVPPPPEPGAAPEVEEPHVHGVTIQPRTGRVYVSDEGEHCFYESVTILQP
jgi:hypothetical protein